MGRGSRAEVIRPKVGEPRKLSGRLKFGCLKRLKASARNCSFTVSVKLVFFTSDTFTLSNPGPSRIFLPALPNVPGAGNANAAVLNHSDVVGFDNSGLLATFGRSFAPKPRIDLPVPLLSSSGSSATVNGRPVCNCTMPKVSQPLITFPARPSACLNGSA